MEGKLKVHFYLLKKILFGNLFTCNDFIFNRTKFKALTFINSMQHIKSNYWGVHLFKSIQLIVIISLIFTWTTSAQPYTSNDNYFGICSSDVALYLQVTQL